MEWLTLGIGVALGVILVGGISTYCGILFYRERRQMLSEMERLQNIAERYREQFQVLYDQEQTRRRLGEERLRLEGRLLWERERRENPHREVTLPEQTGIEISSGDPDPSATGGATGSQADFLPSPLEMYSFDPTLCSWILELPGIGIPLTLLAGLLLRLVVKVLIRLVNGKLVK